MTHMNAEKRVLKYVQGTSEFGVLFSRSETKFELEITVYSDVDWCDDKSDKKSTSGNIFFLGNTHVSWSSTKEHVVNLSSCKSEYIAAYKPSCQGVWLESLMKGLKVGIGKKMKLLVDNKSAISLANHPTSHGRSKHIKTKFHFIREQVTSGRVEIEYYKSEEQLVDLLTEALKRDRFNDLRKLIGVVNVKDF